MSEAVKEYKELSKDKLLKELQWQKEEAWRREQGRLDYARNEGMEQGKLKGKQEGLQEGKLKRNLEIATKMLESNTDIDFISKITGLSFSQIKKLKSKDTL